MQTKKLSGDRRYKKKNNKWINKKWSGEKMEERDENRKSEGGGKCIHRKKWANIKFTQKLKTDIGNLWQSYININTYII